MLFSWSIANFSLLSYNKSETLPKIFDFGLSRIAGKNDSTLGVGLGTYPFSAPELYQPDHTGETHFTNAVDIYSFGVTAWYISGVPLPQHLSEVCRLYNPLSFNVLPQEIPKELAKILDRCVAYDPQERPKIEEIVELIGKYLLFGKHRALALVLENSKTFTLNKMGQTIRVGDGQSGLLIKYDGLEFIVEGLLGIVLANNSVLNQGSIIPKSCVLTIVKGISKKYVTFDISNPEVLL